MIFLLHNVIVHNADGVSFVKKQVTNVFPTNVSMSVKLNESNVFSEGHGFHLMRFLISYYTQKSWLLSLYDIRR